MTPLERNALAFDAAVSNARPMLVRMAYRQLGNHDDAEDAVQDALLLAHKNLERFRGDSSLPTWIGRIVINCALMHRRRSRRFHGNVDLNDVSFGLQDPQPSAEATCVASVEHQRLIAAITHLSIPLRESLLLRMAGLPVQEIADRENVPIGTVKARLSRAKAKIRKRIAAA
jgi:RNA polymerase sigma factor (sigma-70 family)